MNSYSQRGKQLRVSNLTTNSISWSNWRLITFSILLIHFVAAYQVHPKSWYQLAASDEKSTNLKRGHRNITPMLTKNHIPCIFLTFNFVLIFQCLEPAFLNEETAVNRYNDSPVGREISCLWHNNRGRTWSGATLWRSGGNLEATERKWEHAWRY